MHEDLPITIKINHEISQRFSKLASVVNKLEAQYNFRTMTAGWYGDEDNIVDIRFSIESPESFALLSTSNEMLNEKKIADDVMTWLDKEQNIRFCFVAITENEQDLLVQHEKLLASFFDKKLSKVLNLLANELNVSEI